MLKLIVGLGNPGAQYAANRHNVGYMAVERIHARWNGAPWRGKFQGEVAEATVDGTRVLLVKPVTYMNESGRAVAEAARFYKVPPDDIVVVHDEIDLPPGRFKVKTGGGTGGHNGLRSLSRHVGDATRRLRIGVGHPGRKELVPGYVLHDFAKSDGDWLEPMLTAFAEEAGLLAAGEDAKFASAVHLRLGEGARSTGAARRAARSAARAEAPASAEPPASPEPTAPARAPERAGPFGALANLLRR
ncbi:aminoacyl-tRNA hydrolase [Acuticoccus sp.]|uniref:aminoacyl-tRNA hydrolase n=1 Tax=Acuticoccus sp. TaxID=1904378 RepID=UPI003B515943